jgi:hypothetical protein
MAFDGDTGKITNTGQMIHEQPLVDMAKLWIASRTLFRGELAYFCKLGSWMTWVIPEADGEPHVISTGREKSNQPSVVASAAV